MGGKCEFAATAQRLSQFAEADIHATEILSVILRCGMNALSPLLRLLAVDVC